MAQAQLQQHCAGGMMDIASLGGMEPEAGDIGPNAKRRKTEHKKVCTNIYAGFFLKTLNLKFEVVVLINVFFTVSILIICQYTDSIPTDSIPTDSIPTDSIPTDSILTDSILTDSILTDSILTDSILTDSIVNVV